MVYEKVRTRPTKPGDLLLSTRIQNGLTLGGVQSFTSCRLQSYVYCGWFCTTKYKKDLKRSSIWIRLGLLSGKILDYGLERLRHTE